MGKRVYISADYSEVNGDKVVVEKLQKWGEDDLHKVDFIDMALVKSGSVSNERDCRICDLKKEFNKQINASSAVICVVGDKTESRTAGCECERLYKSQNGCQCTPYKQNVGGKKECKVSSVYTPTENDDFGCINSYSFLRHEFEQAKKKKRTIIILYNSLRKESNWLPAYMSEYKENAHPFWIINDNGEKVGDYSYIKEVLGF